LSDLAASLEGSIGDDQPSSMSAVSGPTDNSLRSQIIRNAIAKGKQADQQKQHPLAGGLFDSIQGISGALGIN